MKRLALVAITLLAACTAGDPELARQQGHARAVTITRDDWGIAHVKGKTDADAVFGMIYAQAEDDFNRVETNYLNSLGWMAKAEGESAIWSDLRQRLFIDEDSLRQYYSESPEWLRSLMDAWADGLNYYLHMHPETTPRAITRFEPWMALSFTEGSIGGDIERVNLRQLEAFYGDESAAAPADAGTATGDGPPPEPSGSNGIAISPANTVDGHALLLINPHTSFFFRSELQMTSDEGLNAYGAVTWGQIFIYQGFNERTGWMHTSSAVDAMDEYLETVSQQDGAWYYEHGGDTHPFVTKTITIPYRTDAGTAERSFTVYYSPHGPVTRRQDDRWVTFALMNEPIKALTQSYSRTKAHSYTEFKESMELHTNSSNNTIYADADGNIAYFHGNFIPERDTSFDWTRPVDGSDPATDWRGLLPVDSSPNLFNPASGWLYNSNDSPWEAAGPSSRKQANFPKYVDNGSPSARGHHAVLVLQNRKDFTLDGLMTAAYDSYLPWFETPLPALLKAYDALPASDALKAKLTGPIEALRGWDLRWGVESVPTAVAVFWGSEIRRVNMDARRTGMSSDDYLKSGRANRALLEGLSAAVDRLTEDFGRWDTPWGEINRFQRLTGDIVQPFNDDGPSIPVGFTSGTWGSLASFGARPYPGTKKWYGTSGNSFVAVVEFGDSVRARAVTAGGESGHPESPHFNDEAQRYADGNLREVYFYPGQLVGHTEEAYHPGERKAGA